MIICSIFKPIILCLLTTFAQFINNTCPFTYILINSSP